MLSGARNALWRAGLLLLLAVALYSVPYLDASDNSPLLTTITLVLFLGVPLLVGALVQSSSAIRVTVIVGGLLAITYVLELGGETEFFTDAFALPTIVLMTAIEAGSAAIGISLGRRWLPRGS